MVTEHGGFLTIEETRKILEAYFEGGLISRSWYETLLEDVPEVRDRLLRAIASALDHDSTCPMCKERDGDGENAE